MHSSVVGDLASTWAPAVLSHSRELSVCWCCFLDCRLPLRCLELLRVLAEWKGSGTRSLQFGLLVNC